MSKNGYRTGIIHRRSFLQLAGRAFVLAGVVAIPAVLLGRRQVEQDAASCGADLACSKCKKQKSCERPEKK